MADKVRIFADIDGTMAEWREAASFSTLLQKGYFRSLRPNPSVIRALELIQLENGEEFEIYSLSAYLSESETAITEKEEWLREYAAFIPEQNRLFCPCGSDKREVVPGGIRDTDVLLDDYTHNLLVWDETGRGLKLLNGINGTKGRWKGAAVSMFQSAESIAEHIISFALGGATSRATACFAGSREE